MLGMFWIPAQAGMTVRGERRPTRTLKRPWRLPEDARLWGEDVLMVGTVWFRCSVYRF